MFLRLLPTQWAGVTTNIYARWVPNVSKYEKVARFWLLFLFRFVTFRINRIGSLPKLMKLNET